VSWSGLDEVYDRAYNLKMSYFTEKDIASRYHKYRPCIHPVIIEKIKRLIKLDKLVNNALDIGCGTGQSTVALKSIAKHMIGIDISEEASQRPRMARDFHPQCCKRNKGEQNQNLQTATIYRIYPTANTKLLPHRLKSTLNEALDIST